MRGYCDLNEENLAFLKSISAPTWTRFSYPEQGDSTFLWNIGTDSKNCKNSKYSCHCRPLNVCHDWFWDIHVSRDDRSWDKLSINSVLQLGRCLQTFCLSRKHSSLICRQVSWIIICSVQQYRMWCTSDWWWQDRHLSFRIPSCHASILKLFAACCIQYLKHLNAGFN